MFFIAGITGHVGGAAARILLEKGCKVRTLSRHPEKAADWAKQGVEVLTGDFNDAATLSKALKGVEGAFLLMPPIQPSPGYTEAQITVASFQKALKEILPPRLVILSSFGSHQPYGLGNITSTHLLEKALENVNCPLAIVRPGTFIENYTYGLKQAEATGTFDIFLTPTYRKVPMTATRDIGAEVAKLLMEGWKGTKIVEIGTRISPDELASAMSKIIGRPVKANAVPRKEWTKTLAQTGFLPGRTGPFEEMMDGINSGWIDFGAPGAESVLGKVSPLQVFTPQTD